MIPYRTVTLSQEQKAYFETLIHEHGEYWEKYTQSKTKNKEIAEELMQQVYLTLGRAIAKGRQIIHPLSYGTDSINNAVADYHRRKRTHTSLPDDFQPADPSKEPIDAIIAAEDQQALRHKIQDVIQTCQEKGKDLTILLARACDKRTYEQLATENKCNTKRIRGLIYRQRKKFIKIFTSIT